MNNTLSLLEGQNSSTLLSDMYNEGCKSKKKKKVMESIPKELDKIVQSIPEGGMAEGAILVNQVPQVEKVFKDMGLDVKRDKYGIRGRKGSTDIYYWVFKNQADLDRYIEEETKRLKKMQSESLDEVAEMGPVKVVVEKYWNTLHDFEDELGNALQEYDVAASYKDNKQGSKAAEEVIGEINSVISQLEKISNKSLGDLYRKEVNFIKKFGTPEEYSNEERNKMFPN